LGGIAEVVLTTATGDLESRYIQRTIAKEPGRGPPTTAGMRRSLFGSLLVSALLASAAAPALAQSPGITVFAAASLTEAFNAAGPAFTKKTGIPVTFNFGGSDTLATQIKQGAPADVFASANLTQMKVVSDAGLVAGAPKTFAKNHLVAIAPKSDAVKIAGPADLARPGLKVVLADKTVPVGSYARATFAKLEGQTGYPAGFAAGVEKNVVSNELDVKAVVTKIALGEADAGVVYSTDVTPAVAGQLDEYPFPAAVAPDIEYPIAALKNAPNPKGAQAFVDYILSPDGQAFLKARGFVAP
jgi:molybdate transport system substrate-binding protein